MGNRQDTAVPVPQIVALPGQRALPRAAAKRKFCAASQVQLGAIAALLMAITPAPRRPASATPTWEEAGSVGSLGTRSRRAERSRVFERVHGRRDLGLATQGTSRFRSSVDPTPIICFPQPLLRLSTSFPRAPGRTMATYRDLSIALLLKHQNFAYLPVAAITASHLLGIVTSRSSSSCHPTAFQAC